MRKSHADTGRISSTAQTVTGAQEPTRTWNHPLNGEYEYQVKDHSNWIQSNA